MAGEDPRSLQLRQDMASNISPMQLVDQWIEVEGLGLGRILSYNKRTSISPLEDSPHVVEFEALEPRKQTVVLRRRKMLMWNKGRRFYLAAAPSVPLASPAAIASSTLAAAEELPPPRPPQLACSQAEALSAVVAPAAAKFARLKNAAFLSHYKVQAGSEARIVHGHLKKSMGEDNDIFLDSDDLQDLRLLLEHVKASDVLVLLQTKSVFERPWVIMELHTAIMHNVPIVALNISNSYPYDFDAALDFLTHFETEIDVANPDAASFLVDHGVDPLDVAWRLSTVLPSIISTAFNPNGSTNAIE